MASTGPLYRSRDDRVLGGVLGGVAQHMGWNATWVRLGFVLVSVLSAAFPGILVYLIAWLFVPEQGTS